MTDRYIKIPFSALIQSDRPVLVDFWSETCSPCLALMPMLDELAVELAGIISIVKVDVNEHLELTADLGVRGLPAFVIYQNGQEKWRRSGWLRKETLRDAVEQLLPH